MDCYDACLEGLIDTLVMGCNLRTRISWPFLGHTNGTGPFESYWGPLSNFTISEGVKANGFINQIYTLQIVIQKSVVFQDHFYTIFLNISKTFAPMLILTPQLTCTDKST